MHSNHCWAKKASQYIFPKKKTIYPLPLNQAAKYLSQLNCKQNTLSKEERPGKGVNLVVPQLTPGLKHFSQIIKKGGKMDRISNHIK
ncbi:hypothetical protein X474_26875 [Dethiosulfatarculus sandiegensis]|uniref:Uncharacterized protein n=1 Tax=Dethiosulfatarculus sandiegensis TaxID=1429043 RepID=A0A0D2HK26_9BACT|nr:hypothetical protein X474_26875 [Dethiosulfatarculus sandiegensis]